MRSGIRTAGFTLVELLMVVVILSILAVIVVPQFTEATDNAEHASLHADVAEIQIHRVGPFCAPITISVHH